MSAKREKGSADALEASDPWVGESERGEEGNEDEIGRHSKKVKGRVQG